MPHVTKCKGPHDWSNHVTLRDPDFQVAYAGFRTCKVCGWQEIENYCESRSSGGEPRLFPPGTVGTFEKPLKHTAIYLRVSSKSQDTRSQKPEMERWAKNHDGPVRWYSDHASGASMARPGWEKLWAGVLSGEVERVVCWRIDRLGRTMRGLAELFETLPRLGVELVSMRDGVVGLDSPNGRLMAAIVANFAVYEREIRLERQTAGIAAAKAAGKAWGGAVNKGKRLKVTPEQETSVRRLKAEGSPVAAIARATGLSRPTVYSVLNVGKPI